MTTPETAPPPPDGPAAPPTTNRFAVASLVTGVLTPCGVAPGVASVILGAIALRQIRRLPQPGAHLAVSGLVVTGVWLAVIALATVTVTSMLVLRPADPAATPAPDAAGTPSPERGPGDRSDPERVSVFDLVEGQCVADLWSDDTGLYLPIVPCDEPHDGQVYALFDLPDGDWPGAESVERDASDRCLDTLEADFPRVSDDEWLDFSYFMPSAVSWSEGDREVVCFTVYLDDQRTGSLFDDGDYPRPVPDRGPQA